VTTELLGGTDPTESLHLIANRAQELTSADYTIIALPNEPDAAAEDVTSLEITVCAGLDAATMTGRRIPIEGSTAGAVLRDHVPRSVPNLGFDFSAGLGVRFGPALVLPLRAGEAVFGVLLVVRAPGGTPFEDDQ